MDITIFILFGAFVITSFAFNYEKGIQVGQNFLTFAWDMIKLLPPAFILIGLFEVWVKRETMNIPTTYLRGCSG